MITKREKRVLNSTGFILKLRDSLFCHLVIIPIFQWPLLFSSNHSYSSDLHFLPCVCRCITTAGDGFWRIIIVKGSFFGSCFAHIFYVILKQMKGIPIKTKNFLKGIAGFLCWIGLETKSYLAVTIWKRSNKRWFCQNFRLLSAILN